jgi:hypothetical protein
MGDRKLLPGRDDARYIVSSDADLAAVSLAYDFAKAEARAAAKASGLGHDGGDSATTSAAATSGDPKDPLA